MPIFAGMNEEISRLIDYLEKEIRIEKRITSLEKKMEADRGLILHHVGEFVCRNPYKRIRKLEIISTLLSIGIIALSIAFALWVSWHHTMP